MKISEWLNDAQAQLAAAGVADAAIDARWMAEDTLGMSRTELKFEGDRMLSPAQLSALNAMVRRRAAGEPVQYILQSADFMGLRFYVDNRALIPRQDTETLAEAALVDVQRREKPAVLDLCAGSGCIGLSVKTLAPDARLTLADVSRDALEVARRNAHQLGVDAELRHGDLFEAVGRAKFDVIVSNPPYIPHAELAGLQREVQREPMLALDGGADGLDLYRRIAAGIGAHLNPGGSLYLEVGIGEAEAVRAMLPGRTGIIRDLNGIDRVVWMKEEG